LPKPSSISIDEMMADELVFRKKEELNDWYSAIFLFCTLASKPKFFYAFVWTQNIGLNFF
jgi:hypothetical protein